MRNRSLALAAALVTTLFAVMPAFYLAASDSEAPQGPLLVTDPNDPRSDEYLGTQDLWTGLYNNTTQTFDNAEEVLLPIGQAVHEVYRSTADERFICQGRADCGVQDHTCEGPLEDVLLDDYSKETNGCEVHQSHECLWDRNRTLPWWEPLAEGVPPEVGYPPSDFVYGRCVSGLMYREGDAVKAVFRPAVRATSVILDPDWTDCVSPCNPITNKDERVNVNGTWHARLLVSYTTADTASEFSRIDFMPNDECTVNGDLLDPAHDGQIAECVWTASEPATLINDINNPPEVSPEGPAATGVDIKLQLLRNPGDSGNDPFEVTAECNASSCW